MLVMVPLPSNAKIKATLYSFIKRREWDFIALFHTDVGGRVVLFVHGE